MAKQRAPRPPTDRVRAQELMEKQITIWLPINTDQDALALIDDRIERFYGATPIAAGRAARAWRKAEAERLEASHREMLDRRLALNHARAAEATGENNDTLFSGKNRDDD